MVNMSEHSIKNKYLQYNMVPYQEKGGNHNSKSIRFYKNNNLYSNQVCYFVFISFMFVCIVFFFRGKRISLQLAPVQICSNNSTCIMCYSFHYDTMQSVPVHRFPLNFITELSGMSRFFRFL